VIPQVNGINWPRNLRSRTKVKEVVSNILVIYTRTMLTIQKHHNWHTEPTSSTSGKPGALGKS
jgi:hypothetical protein